MHIVKVLHPILLPLFRTKVEHTVHYLNRRPQIPGNAIYAANHGTKYDIPYAGIAIRDHAYLALGTQRLAFLDRLAFILNGSVWIDRKDRASKAQGAKKMLDLLLAGNNLLIFPEATWNAEPSLPILPMAWGVIGLAQATGCPIIPLIEEYRDSECYIKFGEPFYCEPEDDKLEKIHELRDVMATLRWDIWEQLPRYRRADIPDDEWEKEVATRVAAYPPLDFAYEQSCIRREKGVTTPEEAFSHLNDLISSRENAFLRREKK